VICPNGSKCCILSTGKNSSGAYDSVPRPLPVGIDATPRPPAAWRSTDSDVTPYDVPIRLTDDRNAVYCNGFQRNGTSNYDSGDQQWAAETGDTMIASSYDGHRDETLKSVLVDRKVYYYRKKHSETTPHRSATDGIDEMDLTATTPITPTNDTDVDVSMSGDGPRSEVRSSCEIMEVERNRSITETAGRETHNDGRNRGEDDELLRGKEVTSKTSPNTQDINSLSTTTSAVEKRRCETGNCDGSGDQNNKNELLTMVGHDVIDAGRARTRRIGAPNAESELPLEQIDASYSIAPSSEAEDQNVHNAMFEKLSNNQVGQLYSTSDRHQPYDSDQQWQFSDTRRTSESPTVERRLHDVRLRPEDLQMLMMSPTPPPSPSSPKTAPYCRQFEMDVIAAPCCCPPPVATLRFKASTLATSSPSSGGKTVALVATSGELNGNAAVRRSKQRRQSKDARSKSAIGFDTIFEGMLSHRRSGSVSLSTRMDSRVS